jgi:hypothetical protein
LHPKTLINYGMSARVAGCSILFISSYIIFLTFILYKIYKKACPPCTLTPYSLILLINIRIKRIIKGCKEGARVQGSKNERGHK